MGWTNKSILAVLELVIYLLLLIPFAHSAFKHRKSGIITHVYLFIFVMLRIVADGITISERNDSGSASTAGAIVNSIGLSPLLLAGTAVLNMVRQSFNGGHSNENDKRKTLLIEIAVHVVVVTGVALLATGGSSLANATIEDEVNKDHHLSEIGAVLLVLVWLVLCIWACFLFRQRHRRERPSPSFAIQLLIFSSTGLAFIGIRAIYSLVYSFDHSSDLNPATAGFAVQFIVIFLVELAAFSIILLGLLVAIKAEGRQEGYKGMHGTITSPGRTGAGDIELHSAKSDTGNIV